MNLGESCLQSPSVTAAAASNHLQLQQLWNAPSQQQTVATATTRNPQVRASILGESSQSQHRTSPTTTRHSKAELFRRGSQALGQVKRLTMGNHSRGTVNPFPFVNFLTHSPVSGWGRRNRSCRTAGQIPSKVYQDLIPTSGFLHTRHLNNSWNQDDSSDFSKGKAYCLCPRMRIV